MTTSTATARIFDAYFRQRAERADAFSLGDQIALVDTLLREAEEQGMVPIAADRVARVPPDSPRVRAILEGRDVAIGGAQIQGGQTWQQRMAALPPLQKVLILVAVFLVPGILLWGLGAVRSRSLEASETPAALAAADTATPTPTLDPASLFPTPTPYGAVLADSNIPDGPNDPVSIAFSSLAFTLGKASLGAPGEPSGEWKPAVAEWLPGTEVRRVVAVPYSQEVGAAVAGMKYGDLLTLRLRSGETAYYTLTDIRRVQRYQIEILNDPHPSLVVILHSERSGERWVLVAEAVQDTNLPLPTPRSGGFVFATPTPDLAFTPPAPVTEVYTDSLTVDNPQAGLRLHISHCANVVQVGAAQGAFVVCDVTLTALQDGVRYSGDTLAITERAQVEQVPGWWPAPLSVIGAFGTGEIPAAGQSLDGKVAGEVAKGRSAPLLLWEQGNLRFVISLDEALQ